MLAERGAAEELPLAETVQGIISARLDALSPEEKALLQDSSVHGKVFWAGALVNGDAVARRLVEERLHGLERKEFVQRARVVPRSRARRSTRSAIFCSETSPTARSRVLL